MTTPPPPTTDDDLQVEERKDQVLVHLRGPLDHQTVPGLWKRLSPMVDGNDHRTLCLDLDGVTRVDTSGLALVEELCERGGDGSRDVVTRNIPDNAEAFLALVRKRRDGTEGPPEEPEAPGFVVRTGDWLVGKRHGAREFVTFLGGVVRAGLRTVFHPREWRVEEVLLQLQRGGTSAIPLVMGLSFLIGVIMAFQSSGTIVKFAGASYVANAITVVTTERMAPLLTAIIVASRSGTGYAAELGTMQVESEIDALTVMGYDVASHLVLPRVVALVAAVPLLAMIGDLSGILGSLTVAHWMLGVPVPAYFDGVRQALEPHSIYGGLLRAVVFGALIALSGCFLGLRAGKAPESVGQQTTSAVVTCVILIIIADSAFAALYTSFGWGMQLGR